MACELARQGLRCTLIDKSRGPAEESRALGIQARTMELFDQWGIVDKFLAKGLRLEGVHLYNEVKESLARVDLTLIPSRYPYILSLPQHDTEEILIEYTRSLGVEVERGVELIELRQDAGGVGVVLRDEVADKDFNFAYVVGCDGAHSKVREMAGIEFEGSEYPGDFLLADVDMEWPGTLDDAHIYTSTAGIFACFPLPQGRFRIITSDFKRDGNDVPSIQEIQRVVVDRGPIGANVLQVYWSSIFFVHSRIVSKMSEGRTFLVGDAGHIHSPALALGMNTGIQDAANLAWKLALVLRGEAAPTLLDSYAEERMPVERGVLGQTSFVTNVMGGRNRFFAWLRDTLGPTILGMEWAQNAVRGLVSELSISYDSSPIVSRFGVEGPLQPGERAPDAMTVLETGPVRLYEMFREPGHHLLLCSPVDGVTDMSGFNHDLSTEVHVHGVSLTAESGYLPNHFYLVRPDGYIGALGEMSTFRKALDDYRSLLGMRTVVRGATLL